MENKQKYWFRRLSYNSWLPISWEGWVTMVVFGGVPLVILRLTGAWGRQAFVFARHWPLLVAIGIIILAFFRVTRGHVQK
ncbi:MAG: hypothetical protein ACYDIE_07795 [Candidatus Krumholzibacteriia bacterium]